jgi:hypothetical protein
MKKTFVFGLCLALGLALVATVAIAWGPGFGPRFARGFGGPANGVPPIPDLTAEQTAQIQALRDGFLKEIEPLQQELFTKGTELRSLWSSPNPNTVHLNILMYSIQLVGCEGFEPRGRTG